MAVTITVFELLDDFSPGGSGGFAVDLQAFDAMNVEDLTYIMRYEMLERRV
jgi:hypothetical protein